MSDPGPNFSTLLQRVADELVDQGAAAVVLMGSHARGDAMPESDVDIIALGEGTPYLLTRRENWLLSISWTTPVEVRASFHSPREAPGAVPGWRSTRVLTDKSGVAAELRVEALAWTWDVVGDEALDSYVAGEIAGLAEEVHKLVNLREQGNLTGAAVQRAILSFRLGVVMAIHLRILFDTENRLWGLVNERLGEPWRSTQARAFGLGDETFAETCMAALDLYRLAAGEVASLLDGSHRDVVRYAANLSSSADSPVDS